MSNKNMFRKKRARITSYIYLIVNLLFGNLKLDSIKNRSTSVSHQKVISHQDFDTYPNLGKMMRNENGTSLEFEQAVYYTSSNNMDEIMLVKDDGILPGADAFPLNNNKNKRGRHPFGRPRMRRRGPTIQPPRDVKKFGYFQPVRSFEEIDTGLNGRRKTSGDRRPIGELEMGKEYDTFMERMSDEGYELDCSQERFSKLSTNPQTGIIDKKSLIEAKGGLQGEAQGMYKNIRRPSSPYVDLDFEIDSDNGYTHVDYKTPIDFQDLVEKRGLDISRFPSLDTVAYNMGKKIPTQKETFCGLPRGPKSPDEVLHVVNLDLIRDSNQKQTMIDRVLQGAEDKSNNTTGIYFLNYS